MYIENEHSSSRGLSSGVPQGSVLGPLLYSMCVARLAEIIGKHNISYHFYADDFTPYKLRKHLAESLILSRLDFNDIIFYPLTERLINRLQRVQYSAASFVTGKYVNSVDSLFKLGWLPMRERRDWHLLKAVHKALYSNTWPQSLRLEKVKHTRTLRSSSHINLVTPLTRNTFQDCAATVFNSLPTEVKSCVDQKSFSKQTFEILRNRSLNK